MIKGVFVWDGSVFISVSGGTTASAWFDGFLVWFGCLVWFASVRVGRSNSSVCSGFGFRLVGVLCFGHLFPLLFGAWNGRDGTLAKIPWDFFVLFLFLLGLMSYCC